MTADFNPHPTDQQWRDDISSVRAEAGGLFDVSIIDAMAAAELLGYAILGDRSAAELLEALRQAMERIRRAPRRYPALCVACPRPVKRIAADTVFGIATPSVPSPSGAIGFVFCSRCSADRAALPEKAIRGLQRIWPDARRIEITHPAGRA
jgi:hypothetical protein